MVENELMLTNYLKTAKAYISSTGINKLSSRINVRKIFLLSELILNHLNIQNCMNMVAIRHSFAEDSVTEFNFSRGHSRF